ncbi:MAG: LUD domain-containing protein [Anaerolineales bacterium]|nr:LUD domain-containing protein [Anaerolineales bacterium]
MPNALHKHIRQALAQPNLQAALDANSERRLAARRTAMASLPIDLESARQRAHAMRLHTIQNLDGYLAQFIERLQVNGIQVHRAADAAQATQIVLEIARQKDARLIAKAKSMVSEEIELNHALEAAGCKPIETDLGEYIVQLRGERPAHIITPAVHLRRSDVARLFAEELGIPYSEDIPTLTAAARRTLRQVFLEAEIGVSGVNAGVAESGTLCMVTNEGNGRMVTTLPPVHIALMGIERLVPTMADLALLLELLPRSATGQKLSVYTSLINAPRRTGEVDGCQERHLVLVDNGRSRLRGTPLSEALLCIRCGACLNACPVFREIGGHAYVGQDGAPSPYPGPIGSVVAPGLFGVEQFGGLARASSLCGACKEACPVDIDLPRLLLRVRAGGDNLQTKSTPPNVPWYLALGLNLFTWIATRPAWFGLAQRVAGYGSRVLTWRQPWLRLPAITGWGASKDFPRPAARPFHARWAQLAAEPVIHSARATTAAGSSTPPAPEPGIDGEDGVERFARELEALGGQVHFCKGNELVAEVFRFVQSRQIEALLSWEESRLPQEAQGLLEALQRAGVRISHQPDPSLPAGLTGALAGIAATGTLLLPSAPGQPLSVSLLPEIHLAVLDSRTIQPSLEAALSLPEARQAATLVLETGPSRTADIEMTLTIGVHGPREVHVFCIRNDSHSNQHHRQHT